MDSGPDLSVYFLIIFYPVAGLLIIEVICRVTKGANWIKLLTQAEMCVGFGIGYLIIHAA